MAEISLPNKWEARPYQQPLFNYMFQGGLERKRAACVWHRRAGKDSCSLNLAAMVSQMRVGTIWHMLPTLKQGRKVIWDGIDRYGRKMIDQAFPFEMREGNNPKQGINNSEMQLRMKNGSIYQVVGSDNYDSLVGANPIGVIFSEYSVADPAAWTYIRPILAENGGFAVFIYTARGKNHGYQLHNMAQGNPKWYSSLLTCEDTVYPDGTPIISQEVLDEERAEGMAEEKLQQEYYCSWDAGMEGAFYTAELNLAEELGHVGDFPYDPSKPVQTWWDLGFRDKNAIGFTQRGNDGHPIIIDYMTDRNKGLDYWIKKVNEKPYVYDEHYGPHDIKQTDYTIGKKRIEFAADLGFHFNVVSNMPLEDGIEATRKMIRVARFNKPKCQELLDCLHSYRREFDDKTQLFKDKPKHDWASHGADMMRYLSVDWVGGNNIITLNAKRAGRIIGVRVKRAIGRSR